MKVVFGWVVVDIFLLRRELRRAQLIIIAYSHLKQWRRFPKDENPQ